MLQSHETVNPSLRAMLHLCPLTPTHTAEDLGITLDQLSAMLGNARTSNYHTRPPPCESKSKEAKKPPPRFGYASGQFPYCFTTSSQLLKAVNKKKPLVSSSSTSVLSSPGQSAASTPSNGGGGYNLSGNDFGQQQDYSPVGGDGLRGSSASSPHGPTISASVAGSVFTAADGSVDATTLVTNAPPINARHCSLFFEIYAAQGGKYSLEMMERLMRFCTHNPPEFVLKVQLTALHLFLHVLHLRATYGQGASGGLRHPVDYKSLPRTVVEGILISSAVVNQSLADEELTPAEAAVSDSSSTGKRAMACLDAVQSFSHLLSSLPVLSRGSPPAFVVSNTHFSFIVDTSSANNNITTTGNNTNATMDESDMMALMSGGQPSKDRYFSAQVRFTNTMGKDNHANFGTLASSSTNPDQLLMVKLSQYQVRVDGVIVEDEKGSTTNAADKKSNDQYENDDGVNAVAGMSMYGAPDVQLFLEKESIKRGDSGRLLISLIAKSEATFRSCEIIAVLTIDGVSKVVVTFVVVNPSQPQFATLPPCCLYQHVQESRLGTYDIPLVLQILRQSFQLKQGFAWEEVSKLLSTNLKQHSHTNGQLLSRVLFLQDALDDVATGSSLIPLLWSDPSSGSVLAPNYAMVTSSSSSSGSPIGVVGGGGANGGNGITAVTTPAMRTLVPMSSAHPIGYTPGSLFPLNAQSTSSQQSSSRLTLEKILPRACLATYARMLDGSSTADEYEDGAIIVLGGETGSSSSSPPVLVSPEDTLGLIMVFISMFPIPLVDERILTCDPAAYLESAQPCVQGILLFVIDFCCCLLMYTNDNHTTVRTLALAFAPLLIRSPFFSARRDTGRAFSSSPLRPPPSQQLHGMGTYMRNQEAYINEQNSYLSEMGSPPSLDRGSSDFPSRSVSNHHRRPLLPQPEEFATFVQLETHVVTALIHWIKRYQKLYTSNHHR